MFMRVLRRWRHWASTRVYRRRMLSAVRAHKKTARLFAAFSVFVAGEDFADAVVSVQGRRMATNLSVRDAGDGHGDQNGAA
jgi:hypothetical protein